MPLERRSLSQVVTFSPAQPSYTQGVIAAGTTQNGDGSNAAYVVIPPLLTSAGGVIAQSGDIIQLHNSSGVLKEPTLFRVSSVSPNAGLSAWTAQFTPLPAVTPVAGDKVVSVPRPGNPRWLGAIGHVAALKYAYTCPGGPSTMSCVLQVPPDLRTDALNPGRVVQVYRGASCVWEGVLAEPQPSASGWNITAAGAGAVAANFADIWTTWNSIDDHVNEAIARGLRWQNPGIGTPSGAYLAQVQNSGSETIADFLKLVTGGGGLLWDVQEGLGSALPAGPPRLRVFPYPTAQDGSPNGPPSRLLVTAVPVARTVTADINTLVMYYQSFPQIQETPSTPVTPAQFATVVVQNSASVRQHGTMEYFIDLSSSGTMTLPQVQQIGNLILSRYVRANWAGPFTVQPGQYLTAGGVPVDLGAQHAGSVVQLLCSDASLGGEVSPVPITFVVGEYDYDNDTDTATITPYAGVRMVMADMIAAMYPHNFGGTPLW